MTVKRIRSADRMQIEALQEIAANCVISRHNPTTKEQQAIDRLSHDLLARHRMRGAWCDKDKVVVVQILEPETARSWQYGEIMCLPYGWAAGTFGGSLTLTAARNDTVENYRSSCRASIFMGDPMLDVIQNQPFTLAVVNGRNVLRCDRIDYTYTKKSQDTIRSFIDSLQQESAKGWIDEESNFWEVLSHQDALDRYLTASDRLSIGWYNCAKSASVVSEVLMTLKNAQFSQICRNLALNDGALEFAQVVETCDGDFRMVRDYLLNRFKQNLAGVLMMFVDQFAELPDDELSGFALTSSQILLHAFFESAQVTSCGKYLPWLSEDAHMRTLEIQVRDFPEHVNPQEYWQRLPNDLHFGWGHLLDGSDVHVSKAELESMISSFPTCEDPKACIEQADFLLAEANMHKQGCIPPNAVVQLPIGPFVSLELREIGRNVLVALRNSDSLVYYFTVEPDKSYWSAELPYDEVIPEAKLLAEKASAAIKLLVAAVVRDFWVVERRETCFEQQASDSYPKKRKDTNTPRIVYLPRVRYSINNKPDIDSCARTFDSQTRRSHVVAGHVRKSSKRSETQLALAERYGFRVPEGYTFVRPHERGKSTREVFYRSRSALQSLYSALESGSSSQEVAWFKFERDVKMLMENLGFTVQHVASSRNGDKGVDVFATKGSDLDVVNWVIQCKCWNSRRKVEPATVRELIGTLPRYPVGTRGMIVTTSRFSSGAVEEANEYNIRLMDGEEFTERLNADER